MQIASIGILVAGWRWQRVQQAAEGLAPSSLREYLSQWDAFWYLSIATEGYPDSVPVDEAGAVQQNAWAFYPGFPLLVRTVSLTLGADELATGLVVNQLLALGACLLFVDIVARRYPDMDALLPAVGLLMMPASPVLSMFYAEALLIFLALLALNLLSRDRLWWSLAIVPFAALTRSTGAALALTVVVLALRRCVSKPVGFVRRRDLALVAAAIIVGLASVLAWPVFAATTTGRADALTASYGAWGVSPALGLSWLPVFTSVHQYIALTAVMSAALLVWQRRGDLSIEIKTFSVLVLAVTVAAGVPGSSTMRHLLLVLAIPLLVVMRQRWIGLLLIALVLKIWWVLDLVVTLGGPDSPP